MKKTYTFKLNPVLLSELQREAKKENRPFNNYVETLLINHPDRIIKKVRIINKKLPDKKKITCDICNGTGYYGPDDMLLLCECNPIYKIYNPE